MAFSCCHLWAAGGNACRPVFYKFHQADAMQMRYCSWSNLNEQSHIFFPGDRIYDLSLVYETGSWQGVFSYHISSCGMMKYLHQRLDFSPSADSI